MVEVTPHENLVITEYNANIQQNPSNIYYQRVQSRNVSNQNCNFTVISPDERAFLQSDPNAEWTFTFTRVDTNATFVPQSGAALPYANNRDLISLKPVLPVTNAMSSITTAINGSTNTISQPRRFMECISMLHVSREDAKKKFEAGYPERMGGTVNQNFPSITWAYNERDHTMEDQYYDFAGRQLRPDRPSEAHLAFFGDGSALDTGGKIVVTEPIISPPFNCYSKVDLSKMPVWSPWKNMGKVLPRITRLNIDIQFTKLDASIMYYWFGKSEGTAPARPPGMIIGSGGVSADLLLYWVTVPVSTSIPMAIDLPTYDVREFLDTVEDKNDMESGDTSTSLIQLESTPSLFITHLERQRDDGTYQPVACCSQDNDDDAAALRVRTGGAIHNWDNYGEINTIRYELGDRPNVISATFSQRELYDLTVKNSNNFPYTFDDWRGRKRPQYNAGAFLNTADVRQGVEVFDAAWLNYPCKGMVAVTATDIANKTSTGVFSSNSIRISVNWRPRSGFGGTTPGNNSYLLYTHLIYSKTFIRLQKESARFENQSLDAATARRLTDPPLGNTVIPGLPAQSAPLPASTGGALSVGGSSLRSLRNRGVSAIQSRF